MPSVNDYTSYLQDATNAIPAKLYSAIHSNINVASKPCGCTHVTAEWHTAVANCQDSSSFLACTTRSA